MLEEVAASGYRSIGLGRNTRGDRGAACCASRRYFERKHGASAALLRTASRDLRRSESTSAPNPHGRCSLTAPTAPSSAQHPYLRERRLDTRLPAPDEDVELGPNWALQDPRDYIRSLQTAVPRLLAETGVPPGDVIGVGIAFTSCTMLPTLADGTPLCLLDDLRREPHAWVKLWKHHAAQPEADRINAVAAERDEPWLAATAAGSRPSGSSRSRCRSSTRHLRSTAARIGSSKPQTGSSGNSPVSRPATPVLRATRQCGPSKRGFPRRSTSLRSTHASSTWSTRRCRGRSERPAATREGSPNRRRTGRASEPVLPWLSPMSTSTHRFRR